MCGPTLLTTEKHLGSKTFKKNLCIDVYMVHFTSRINMDLEISCEPKWERQLVTFSEESRTSYLILTLRRNELLWERLLETNMDALWTQIMLVPVLQGSQSFLQMRQALHHCREPYSWAIWWWRFYEGFTVSCIFWLLFFGGLAIKSKSTTDSFWNSGANLCRYFSVFSSLWWLEAGCVVLLWHLLALF